MLIFVIKILQSLHFLVIIVTSQTIHVVTPPTNLTCGVGLEVYKYEEKTTRLQFQSCIKRLSRLQIHLDALHGRDTFVLLVLKMDEIHCSWSFARKD